MAYRKFDTTTWQDPWFEDLSPNAKLAFIYLWTNETCNQAGIYEISEKRIKFELGYGIDTIYKELEGKIEWYPDKKIVWVKNFFRRQCQNSKFAISALNSIKNNRFAFQLFIQYNQGFLSRYKCKELKVLIDTISIPYPTETEQNRTETEADTDTETDARAREGVCESADEFECDQKPVNGKSGGTIPGREAYDLRMAEWFQDIFSVYPKKQGEYDAQRAFVDLDPDQDLVDTIVSAIKQFVTSVEWTNENGRYVPKLERFFNSRMWLDTLTYDETTTNRSWAANV